MNSEEIIKSLIKINDDLNDLKNKIDPSYKKTIIDKIDNKEIKSLDNIPINYRDDYDIMILFYKKNIQECLDNFGFFTYYLSDKLKNNKKFFLDLYNINNNFIKYIQYFGEKIKFDLDIMEIYINNFPNCIIYYKNNKDFIIKMIKKKPELYKFLGSSEIFYDKDVMKTYLLINKLK
jgi:hypothetical protein